MFKQCALIAITGLALLAPTTLPAQSALEQRVAQLEERIRVLESQLEAVLAKVPAREAPAEVAAVPQPVPQQPVMPLRPVSVSGDYQATGEGETRLPVTGYMEAHLNKLRGDPGQFDFHRFVLLFGHSFSDRIKFWSELELEHALIEGGEEKGEIELEQAYLDFLIKPWFNFRGGMLLTPVGIQNERHEPPSFNGVERTQVETVIIPSTWHDLGVGLTGEFARGFRYRGYLMGGLDATGFDAEQGLREGRQQGFQSSFRNPAKVGRLEYVGVPRMTLGASLFTGSAGFNLETVNPRVDLFSFDGRYSRSRFDFRGLFAQSWISRAGELNTVLERQFGFNPNVGSQMRGYYMEPGVHIFPRRTRHDMILFSRYEKYNTQHKMPEGFVPLPQFNRSSWVVGATYLPNADVAIKFDYSFNRNASSVVSAQDGVNFGIGWWF